MEQVVQKVNPMYLPWKTHTNIMKKINIHQLHYSLRYALVFTRSLPVCGYNTKHMGAVTANDMHDKKV